MKFTEIVSLKVRIDKYEGIAVGEKIGEKIIILDRYYQKLNSYDVELGVLMDKETIVSVIYDYGELYETATDGIVRK